MRVLLDTISSSIKIACLFLAFGCTGRSSSVPAPALTTDSNSRPGAIVPRRGDEIMVCGQLVHTGAPVVLWLDPGGYDAYRVERRFAPFDKAGWEASHQQVRALQTPNRYSTRINGLTSAQVEQVRGGGWDLPLLREKIDQFVLHYDVAGVSRSCFTTLHDARCLSVHFMIDLDGTIYQTLDVKERAWHATTSNDRSIGVEIANIGAYPPSNTATLDRWYRRDASGRVRVVLPAELKAGGIRTAGFVGRPARDEPVQGTIQGQVLRQYDFTPEQYEALIHLTATLCTVFPRIRCDYPRDAGGKLVRAKLPDAALSQYQGVLGHYHIQLDKADPGPALQWDRVIDGARRLMSGP